MGDERTAETDLEELDKNGTIDKNSKLWRSADEVHEPDVVTVLNGSLPSWLKGCYLRIGPGKFDLTDEFSMINWLDGYAIASKFAIDGDKNQVSFQSKFMESQAYKGAMKFGKPIFPEYGTKKYSDTSRGFFSNLISNYVPEMSDNPTTAYLNYDSTSSTLFIGGESSYFYEYDPVTMSLGERYDTKDLFGFQLCSMHPLIDINDGSVYNIGTSILTGVRYNIFKISPLSRHPKTNSITKDSFKKSFKLICSINSRWPTGMSGIHSFGQSTNYIVLIEQPYVGNLKRALGNAVKGRIDALASTIEWHPEFSNRFYIVSKSSGEIINKSFEILSESPFFFIHVINCYEEYCKNTKTSFIVIDISCFDTPETLSAQNLEQLRSFKNGFDCDCTADLSKHASCQRFIIPLNLDAKKTPSGVNLLVMESHENNEIRKTACSSNEPSSIDGKIASATRENKAQIILSSKLIMRKGLELNVINTKYAGKPYQYYYGSGLVTLGEFQNAVAKINVHSCEATIFRDSPYYIFGEPIFVPEPKETKEETDKQAEDNGVLIIPMTDSRKDQPDMLFFLNATDMTELGRAIFNERVPPSIHGTFIPNKYL